MRLSVTIDTAPSVRCLRPDKGNRMDSTTQVRYVLNEVEREREREREREKACNVWL